MVVIKLYVRLEEIHFTLQYLTKTFELRERLKLFRLEKSVVSAGK